MAFSRLTIASAGLGAILVLARPAAANEAAIRALPGLAVFQEHVALTASGAGYELSIAGASGVTGAAFGGSGGWHAGLALPNGALGLGVLGDLGGVDLTKTVVVLSSANEVVAAAALPASLRATISPDGAPATLAAGVNVFLAGTPRGDGVLGQLMGVIGGTSVQLHGTVGTDVIVSALKSTGASGGDTPPAGAMSLTATLLGDLMPQPLRTTTTAIRRIFHTVITRAAVTVRKDGSVVSLGGSLRARVTLQGKTVDLDGALTVAKDGDATSVRIKTDAAGGAGVNVPDLLGVNDKDFQLKVTRLGLDMLLVRTPTNTTGTFGLETTVTESNNKSYAGKIFLVADTQGGLREVAVDLVGSLPVPNPSGGDDLTISNPRLGILVASSGGYVAGTVTWRKMSARAVVWVQGRPAGAAMFLRLSNVKLSSILGGSVPMDPQLPSAVVVASSVDLGDLPMARLPSSAAELVAELGASQVSVNRGLGLITSINLGAAVGDATRAVLAGAGISGTYLVGGAFGMSGGKPTATLYGDLPALTLPPTWVDKVPIPAGVKPRFFVSVTGGATPTVSLGGELALTGWKIDGQVPADLLARAFVTVGAASPSLQFTGKLTRDWVSPFYLSGITIQPDTGLSFNFAADGARILMNGNVSFAGASYGLGGGVAVQWATGVPTPKGIALRLKGPEFSMFAAVGIGQIVIRAGANMVGTLVGKTGAPLPQAMRNALASAKNVDFVAGLRRLMPTTGPLATLASFSLRDVDLFLSTPGMADPDFPELDDTGIKIKGALYKDDKRLAGIDSFLTAKLGLQLKADSVSFPLGPLSIDNPSIDIGLGVPGIHDVAPHFAISGATSISGHTLAELDINLSSTEISAAGKIDLCGGGSDCIGGKVSLSGAVTGPNDARLAGAASLNPPKIGEVNLPSFSAQFVLDTDTGLDFSGYVGWEKANFSVEGSFSRPNVWSLSGEANVDTGTKKFEVAGVEIITLKVESGKLRLSMSPSSASIKAKGKASINPIGIAKFDWNFDQEVSGDLRINKTVKYEIAGVEGSFAIKYKVFP